MLERRKLQTRQRSMEISDKDVPPTCFLRCLVMDQRAPSYIVNRIYVHVQAFELIRWSTKKLMTQTRVNHTHTQKHDCAIQETYVQIN